MKKPRNRPKTRRTSGTSRARQEAASPQGDSLVGRASRPSPTPSPPDPSPLSSSHPSPSIPPLPEPQQIDLILRLWERGEFALSDIAVALRIPMPDLIALLQRPDIAALLDQMGNLLDLRLKHIAAKAAPKALATLEAVQTEAEQATTSTPISPQAIKADRHAASARTQRRLSATTILTMHRSLTAASKATLKAAPVSDQMLHQGGMAMQSMAMQDAERQPLQKSA